VRQIKLRGANSSHLANSFPKQDLQTPRGLLVYGKLKNNYYFKIKPK